MKYFILIGLLVSSFSGFAETPTLYLGVTSSPMVAKQISTDETFHFNVGVIRAGVDSDTWGIEVRKGYSNSEYRGVKLEDMYGVFVYKEILSIFYITVGSSALVFDTERVTGDSIGFGLNMLGLNTEYTAYVLKENVTVQTVSVGYVWDFN